MNLRALFLFPTVAVLVVALASCGGGDSDEDKIIEVIETSTLESDPSYCTELQTQTFTEQVEFTSGKDAIESCEEDARDETNDADSVEVTEVRVENDTATANIAFTGSVFDGQTLIVSLVKQDDEWKLDRIEEFVGFDPEQFAAAFVETASTGPDAIPPEQAECIGEGFRGANSGDLQDALLSGSEAELASYFQGC